MNPYDVLKKVNDALIELAKHPAFEDDAPEFNEGGIGYEAIKLIEDALDDAPISQWPTLALGTEMHVKKEECGYCGETQCICDDPVTPLCDELAGLIPSTEGWGIICKYMRRAYNEGKNNTAASYNRLYNATQISKSVTFFCPACDKVVVDAEPDGMVSCPHCEYAKIIA